MRADVALGNWLAALVLYGLLCVKPAYSQGVACYKCMTTDPNNDLCQDPFSAISNPIQNNCQVSEFSIDGRVSTSCV